MGFLTKRATRERIAPVSFPSRLPDTPLERSVASSAIVRASALGLSLDHVISSGLRGHVSPIAEIFKAGASMLWVQTEGSEWYITLGTPLKGGGNTADWELKISDCADDTVAVATNQALTRDDELVNGAAYDEVRSNLTAALNGNGFTVEQADAFERELSDRSLTTVIPNISEKPSSGRWQFTVDSGLDCEAVESAFEMLGLPVELRAPGRRRWRAGIPANPGGTIEVTCKQRGGRTVIDGEASLTPTGSFTADLIASRTVRAGCRRLRAVLARNDDTSAWNGAGELVGGDD